MSNSKSINSIYNAISSILFTIINGLLTIIVTRIILTNYGSDYNGLNTTANQIVIMLLVLESGFTLASNVALFDPISKGDINRVESIISTTKVCFEKIGLLYLIVGACIVIIYSKFITSSIPYFEILVILIISLLPTASSLIFATKYSILFQSEQHEYILNIIRIISCIIGNSIVIILGSMGINRIVFRVIMLLNPLIVVCLIVLIGKRKYKHLKMDLKPDYSLIPGTKDLMIQKFVGLAYSTAPMLIMSAVIGTVATSVYGVYYSVTSLMKSIANSFMNSPRMSLGILIAENNRERIKIVFREYENIVLIFASTMTITYFAMIKQFVNLYTDGINDANYSKSYLAIMLGAIFFIECCHIPSGIYLNMSGMFKVTKNIQSIAALILVVGLIVGIIYPNLNVFVSVIFIAAISLAFMEIGYVHLKLDSKKTGLGKKPVIDMLLFSIITIVMSAIGFCMDIRMNNYLSMVLIAIIVSFFSAAVLICFEYIYNRPVVNKIDNIIKIAIKKDFI